jgi:hypothetical protein
MEPTENMDPASVCCPSHLGVYASYAAKAITLTNNTFCDNGTAAWKEGSTQDGLDNCAREPVQDASTSGNHFWNVPNAQSDLSSCPIGPR